MQNVTESDDFNMAWMEDFIEASATFDSRMNQAVIDSGILRPGLLSPNKARHLGI